MFNMHTKVICGGFPKRTLNMTVCNIRKHFRVKHLETGIFVYCLNTDKWLKVLFVTDCDPIRNSYSNYKAVALRWLFSETEKEGAENTSYTETRWMNPPLHKWGLAQFLEQDRKPWIQTPHTHTHTLQFVMFAVCIIAGYSGAHTVPFYHWGVLH